MATEHTTLLGRLRSRVLSINLRRLKRAGVFTYFFVYACIALGARRGVNAAFASLPVDVRPAPIRPLDVALGLPTSVAWGSVSLAFALAVVVGLAVCSLSFGRAEGTEVSDAPEAVETSEGNDGTEDDDALGGDPAIWAERDDPESE
ncbi:hypothetical protein [Halegenticoccus soli]|uniref:hypothetical protein n=1 Tax=Halegenticoccus soli TaxID=1985678 RepID=UPI000C6CEDED|nr:hypothetical protein [Halegenticoccus soli]